MLTRKTMLLGKLNTSIDKQRSKTLSAIDKSLIKLGPKLRFNLTAKKGS